MASLSRTYRPQTFADITDQDPIKETLRLESETGKLGHAYLFGGPRGVGKTTMARVFAKALNCLKPKKGEPCNACDSCNDLNAGRSIDVIEMDAASNTGVDNVREAIVEHVRFVPQSRKHKVYILDEAHMLSTSAWNALLKTLEEPPAYAVFILITTELHKVPATIQSRCQRFDFKRIPDGPLAKRIEELAKKEGATLDPDVVAAIVSKSDGCLRDGESLLGQLLVLGEKKITAEIASLVLPLSRLPLAANLLDVWSKRELGPALRMVEELEEQGVPLLPVFDDLLQAVRHLLVACGSSEYRGKLSRGDEGERKLAALVSSYEPQELSEMALMLMERRRDAKQGADVRFCLELAASAVSLAMLPHAPAADDDAGPSNKNNRRGDPAVVAQPMADRSAVRPTDMPKTDMQTSRPEGGHTGPPLPKQPPIRPTEPGAETAPLQTKPSNTSSFTLADVQVKWAAFLRIANEESRSLSFVLKLCKPVAVDGGKVTMQFQYPFHKEKIVEDPKTRHRIENWLSQALDGRSVHIEGVVGQGQPEQTEKQSQDMVSKILRAFEGQVVEGGDSVA
jgi:DNA polymerase-3 subunit gamma/tau